MLRIVEFNCRPKGEGAEPARPPPNPPFGRLKVKTEGADPSDRLSLRTIWYFNLKLTNLL